MIAGSEADDARANLLDNAGAFVPRAHREWTGVAAIEVMNIAVAQSARCNADADFIGAGTIKFHHLDCHWLARGAENCGFHR